MNTKFAVIDTSKNPSNYIINLKLLKSPIDSTRQDKEITKLKSGTCIVPCYQTEYLGPFNVVGSKTIFDDVICNGRIIQLISPDIENIKPFQWLRFRIDIYADDTLDKKLGEHIQIVQSRPQNVNVDELLDF